MFDGVRDLKSQRLNNGMPRRHQAVSWGKRSRPVCKELPNARKLFPEVRQRGLGWCLPAGFEVLLHYFSIPVPKQEDMVMEYVRRHGSTGYINAAYQLCKLDNPTVEELRGYGFPVANFNILTSICNDLMPNDSPRQFVHPADCATEFQKHLRNSMAAGDGILAVINNPDHTCHVLPVVGFDGTNLTTYEPIMGNIETKKTADYTVNNDCVILCKK